MEVRDVTRESTMGEVKQSVCHSSDRIELKINTEDIYTRELITSI